MMFLTIENFRCYKHKIIEFKHESVNLISGVSGIGKSTIFSSIAWCLYGSRSIITLPYSSEAKTTRITFQLPSIGIQILRQARPNLLNITYKDKKYDSDEAQNIINELFGANEDIWSCSSYVVQSEKNIIFSIPQNERLGILNAIAYGNNEPSVYKTKIKDKIKDIQIKYDSVCEQEKSDLAKFKVLTNNLSSEISKLLPELTKSKIKKYIENTKDSIAKNEETIKQLKTAYSEYSKKKSEYDSIQDMLSKDSNQLSVLENSYNIESESLDELRSKLASEYKTNKQDIQTELSELNLQYKKNIGIESDYKKQQSQLTRLNQLKANRIELEDKLKELEGIVNNSNNIEKFVNLKDSILSKKYIVEYEKYTELKDLTEKLGNFIEHVKDKFANVNNIEESNVFDILKENSHKKAEYNVYTQNLTKQSKSLQLKIDEFEKLCKDEDFYVIWNIPEFDEFMQSLNIDSQNTFVNIKNNNYHGICKAIIKYSSDIINTFEQNLSDETNHLNTLESSKEKTLKIRNSFLSSSETLKCPNCSCALIMNTEEKLQKVEIDEKKYEQYSKKLSQIETSIKESKESISEFTRIIEYYQKMSDYCKKLVDTIVNFNEFESNKPTYVNFTEDFDSVRFYRLKNYKFEFDCNNTSIEFYNTLHQIFSLQNSIDEIDSKIVSNELNGLSIISEKDYNECSRVLSMYPKMKSELETLLKSMNLLENEISVKTDKIKKLEQSIQKLKLVIESYKNHVIVEEYNSILKDLSDLLLLNISIITNNNNQIHTKFQESISSLQSQIQTSKDLIRDYNLASDAIEFQRELEETKLVIEQYSDDSESYQKILKVIESVENSSLYEIIDLLNSILKEITSELFEDEIDVKFRLYKENKTGNVKNEVGIDIEYKNTNIKNINMLSGGEVSRISISTTIAFNVITNSPFILFDESIGTLDEENTEKVIDAITNVCVKKYNKTVLIIAHSQIEGRFDNVIHLC